MSEAMAPLQSPARRVRLGCAILVFLGAVVFAFLAGRYSVARRSGVSPTFSPTHLPPPTFTPTSTQPPTPSVPVFTPPPTPVPLTFPEGLLVFSMRQGLHLRLFAYAPQGLPLVPLTAPDSDAITPAFSPDGATLAFAARQDGAWDLYLLDLASGEIAARLTHTPAYDGAPSWSPDGAWLVHETYLDDNLELVIQDAAGSQPPVRLTYHPAADYQPTWSPQGRLIAFVSTREGPPQVFIANLDQPPETRFLRVSDPAEGPAAHPAWSPDGRYLAWAQVAPDGIHHLYLWDATQPEHAPHLVGQGDWPRFAPQGDRVLALLTTPYETYLTAYSLEQETLALPPVWLPGSVHGFTVGSTTLPWPLRGMADASPTPLWTPALTPNPDLPNGRYAVVPLDDVEAPHPELSDAADEAFRALRWAVAQATGWDALGRLDYAYTPLTETLLPGQGATWLHTGRAFALSSIPLQAGWAAVVREDYGSQTYWRVFLRTQAQDGSQGMPLHALPWDLLARYRADLTAYETGGAYAAAVPSGYWVDLTDLAAALGWERLPARVDWRAYLPGARWNLFVLRQGLTLEEALAQIYPPAALQTPTPIPTPAVEIRPPTATPGGGP